LRSVLERFVTANDVVVALPNVALLESVRLVAKRFPAVSAVEDAYGNCDAATVDDEKKTPKVAMEVVVAAVVVPKLPWNAKIVGPADAAPHENWPLFHVRKLFTAQMERPAPKNCVLDAIVVLNAVVVALVKSKFVPLIAVVEAYGNCDAATVDDEKKTPCVRILLVVAAVEVPNVLMFPKRYAKLPVAQDCAYTEPFELMVRHCPAEVLRLVMARLVVVALVSLVPPETNNTEVVAVPVMTSLPAIARFAHGEVVPMPTLPPLNVAA
jgi:hypothetical protein